MRRQGRAVIFLHHDGKTGKQRGSSKKEDTLDTVIWLKHPADYSTEQDARFEIHFEKYRSSGGDNVAPMEAHAEKVSGLRIEWKYKKLDDARHKQIVDLAKEGLTQAQIAKELEVEGVMSGRLVQRGEDLSISVQLIDARTGKLIWAEQYDRKMSDLLATQREIATTITEKLQLKLSGTDSKGITKHYTENNEAYQLYLRGRFYGSKRTASDAQKAIEYYQQAVALDPKFALAFAGLAESTHFHALYSYPQLNDLTSSAKDIAMKAIELDSTLAEPHSILGIICFVGHDFNCMEREQKLAIELNSNFSEAHRRLGLVLRSLGRIDEARVETNRALAIDPLSPVTNFQHAQEFFFERKYEESEALGKKNIELDPNFWYAHLQLFSSYRMKGDHASAVEELAKMQEARGEPDAARFIRESFVNNDWPGFLGKITGQPSRLKIYPYFVATFFAELGEKDRAFATLNEAVETKDQHTNQMKVDPFMDALRDDPRFDDVLKKAGFPE